MNTKFFINNGFIKFKLNKKHLNGIKKFLVRKIKKRTKKKSVNLNFFHNSYPLEKVNNLRLYLYNEINSDKKIQNLIYKSSEEVINYAVGSEIAKSKANLSIQYPKDENSLLSMHSDFFSGESLFQVNLWIPFVNVKKTKSMFIINPKMSLEILKKIKFSKKITFDEIYKKYKKKMKWLNVRYGEGIIFSPNCLHGNVKNSEKTTRWSINIRYKNLYSPYNDIFGNEKKIGTFYNIFSPKMITQFNLKHNFNEFQE